MVYVTVGSDSFDTPYMAQIISRIREPGQSGFVLDQHRFNLAVHAQDQLFRLIFPVM